MASVEPWQRFSRSRPCPICEGGNNDRRHRGERCTGYISKDEQYAFCGREEYRGNLEEKHTSPATYAHRLHGPCKCGREHDAAPVRPASPKVKTDTPAKAPTVYKTIPERCPGPDFAAYRKTAVYDDYRDEHGALLYAIVRYEGLDADGKRDKQMRPFCPVAGGWVMKRAERAVLERLPELLAADPRRPVFICEGEKDVQRLAAMGLVATTNAFGASSWSMVEDAPEILRGRIAVVVEDNDKTGCDRTHEIAASLHGKAASVRVVRFPEMPEHGDVSDWLDAGGTKDALYELVIATPAVDAIARTGGENQDDCQSPNASAEAFRTANVHMNQRIQTFQRTVSARTLPPRARITLMTVRQEIERNANRLDADGMLTIYETDKLAEAAGISVGGLRQDIDLLASGGILRKGHVPSTNGNKLVAVGLGSLVDTPWEAPMPEKAPHGGKRAGAGRKRKCPTCDSEDIYVVTYTVTETRCRTCGDITRENGQAHAAYDSREDAPENQDDCQSPSEAGEPQDAPDISPYGYETAFKMNVSPPPEPTSMSPAAYRAELRVYLREYGECYDWPRLPYAPAKGIPAGRAAWENFITKADMADLLDAGRASAREMAPIGTTRAEAS